MSAQGSSQRGKQTESGHRITIATAVVIMLPPDPPIKSNRPDFDSRIAGVMEEGGRSPKQESTCTPHQTEHNTEQQHSEHAFFSFERSKTLYLPSECLLSHRSQPARC